MASRDRHKINSATIGYRFGNREHKGIVLVLVVVLVLEMALPSIFLNVADVI